MTKIEEYLRLRDIPEGTKEADLILEGLQLAREWMMHDVDALRNNYLRQMQVARRSENATLLTSGKLEAVEMILEIIKRP